MSVVFFIIFIVLMAIPAFLAFRKRILTWKNPKWCLSTAIIAFVADIIKWGHRVLAAELIFIITFCGLVVTGIIFLFKKKRKPFKLMMCLAMILSVAIFIIIFIATLIPATPQKTSDNSSPVSSTTSPTPTERVNQKLKDNGWGDGTFVLGTVDESKDKSTTGDLGFNQEGSKSLLGMSTFLGSGKDSAEALIKELSDTTSASREEVLDIKNWVIIQSLIDFKYPGNTSYKNGKVIGAGSRNGSKGDIFFAFVAPNGQIMFVRGACGNPQTIIPKPNQPTSSSTTSSKLTPKDPSQDPAAQGNASVGGGKNQDPGPGTYIPPESMARPPSTARSNPAAPAATTSSATTGTSSSSTTTSRASSSTSSKTTTPPPESQAPTQSDPATGYSPPPGM